MATLSATDVEYLGTSGSGGTCLGQTASDKVGFFGATPVAQQSVTYPSSTATTTTNEAAIVSVVTALTNLGLIVTT